MIASIIPLIKLPRKLSYFDYEIPTDLNLKKYSLVTIPWRNKKCLGIVIKIKPTPRNKILNYKKILYSFNHGLPLTTIQQINLINKLSEKFFVSPSIWWKNVLPNFSTKIDFGNIVLAKQPKISTKKNKNELTISQNYETMIDDIIKKISLSSQQLILCPEIIDIEKLTTKLPEKIIQHTVIYHKQLSNKVLRQNYLQICKGEAKLIIGTKPALLLPFYKLTDIFVLKAENYGFTSADQNPRYNLEQIYEIISSIYKTNLNIYSLSPWLETFTYFKKNKFKIYDQQKIIDYTLVDLNIEKIAKNFTYISWPLEQEIKKTIVSGKKCVLFVNRKGTKQNIFCTDCGWMPVCEKCQSYLSGDSLTGLVCGRCNLNYTFPSTCPRCQGIHLQPYGLTNQTIIQDLKKITTYDDIVFLDSDHANQVDQAKIIVTTKYYLSRLDSQVGLIAFIDADQELIGRNFRSQELAWQYFNNAFRTVNCTKLIQTKNIEHNFWRMLKQFTYLKFWHQEMLWRKKLLYPPYTNTVKLLFKATNKDKADNLKKSIINKYLNKLVIDFIQENYNQIIFRYYHKDNQKIREILSNLPESIMIELNPYEI